MTTLYIKIHNITGLKYFGKTTQIDKAFEKYKGSGKHWSNHLKVHGKYIHTIIVKQFDETNNIQKLMLEGFALEFSEIHNIVKSKEWANEKPENGLDGGWSGDDNHRKELSKRMINQNKDPIMRAKFSSAKKGNKSPTALKIDIYNNDDILQFKCYGNFTKICKENNLPFSALRSSYRNNTKIFHTNQSEKEAIHRNEIQYKGWYAKKV